MAMIEEKVGLKSIGEILGEAEKSFKLTDNDIKPEAESVYSRRRKFMFPGDQDSDWFAAIKNILFRKFRERESQIDISRPS